MSLFDEFKDMNDFKEQCGYTIEGDWYPRVTKIVRSRQSPHSTIITAKQRAIARQRRPRSARRKKARCYTKRWKRCCLERGKRFRKRSRPQCIHSGIFCEQPYRSDAGARGEAHREPRPSLRGHGGRDRAHRWQAWRIDIKTSQAIYRDYNLQTSAYMDALKNEFEDLSTRWILKIDQIQKCMRCGAIRRVKGGREKIKTNWKNPAYARLHT